MTAPIRVALLGYGLAGAVFHAPLIAAVEGLELTAIVTRDDERRSRAQRDHPGTALLDSAEEVWGRADDFGLVVVAAPNRTHVPLARSALEAGLPVVVDKPVAASAAEARLLVREARERGLMLTVFQNRRWDGDFLTVRRLLDEGTLGEVMRFESRFERWRPEFSGGWRESGDVQEAGGLLYDLGSHLVDQALCLFGPAARIYAEVDIRRTGAETDDDTFVALTHESGVQSHLWVSAVAAQPRGRGCACLAAAPPTSSTASTSRRSRSAPAVVRTIRFGAGSRKTVGDCSEPAITFGLCRQIPAPTSGSTKASCLRFARAPLPRSTRRTPWPAWKCSKPPRSPRESGASSRF